MSSPNVKFRTPSEIQRTEPGGGGAMTYRGEATRVFSRMDYLMCAAEQGGRDTLADERREYDALEAIYDALSLAAIQAGLPESALPHVVEPPGAAGRDPDPTRAAGGRAYAEGHPLAKDQTFTGYVAAMGHKEPREVQDALESLERPLSLTKCLRGAYTGDWRDAEPERIMMALSGASAGAGGVMLPTILVARIIDLARAKTRVLAAGAEIVPMENRTVDVPRWLTDPSLAWRAENAAITESDPTMDKITLSAKALGAVTKVSRELVEDTDIEPQLVAAFASALALRVDLTGLYGSGTSNEPTGVKATTAVTKTPLGANGASPTWAALVNSVGRLRDSNEEPTAQIMADRTERTLALLVGSDGQYIRPPAYLDNIPRLTTSQVPLNLTVGTSTDTSDVFTADWTQLMIGVRTQLQITILNERYMPDAGQYGFVAWWRGDFAAARPKAFDVVTGVRP